ncbi:cyclin-T1-3-like [Humulus lupulus]|uniref:cyclin-T1-3-like n=1 Tax=Humulus lupulus TaxID=3486 RepID=UPI002B40C16D|nr:cyclin-T1-3-like [Humulus lupulus]XP_062109099.1 cyclin-T1-3-like [Humulus lupulus]XP_062109100.1 cyclin-T1-3-like [Humulus lupulus]XP_062109101.1 cyclin-T1-3-like [Humulus lupulus]
MAGYLAGNVANHGTYESGYNKHSQDMPEDGGRWYFSRREIEENSPSRHDGVDLKKETYLRKSYCTFLQDLGMRLKVPQVTIATAIIFCHRFFLRQSHAKNDRRTIATVCMFLAGKVEETPRLLKEVILISYEIINKKDPAAAQRIKQKEVYEQQKELILLGERVVLATLGFDFNVLHPYKPLVEAIKKFKVAQNALAQVAWNFVNDGLRTSLCLQFKPHHIAAGAIFLAAKFLKVKLPSDGEKVWWQEFDVTPRQLEEVSNQMLELYEQNRAAPSSDVEGSSASGVTHGTPVKATTSNEEYLTNNDHSQAGSTRPGASKPVLSRPASELSHADNHGRHLRTAESRSNDYRNTEMNNGLDHKVDGEFRENHYSEPRHLPHRETGEENQQNDVARSETGEARELKSKHQGRNPENRHGRRSPQEVIKIDKDKVKAALEKRRNLGGDATRKTDVMDDDDLIERELEDGIEFAAGNEKNKQDHSRRNWSKPSHRLEHEDSHQGRDEQYHQKKGQTAAADLDNVEEGEL